MRPHPLKMDASELYIRTEQNSLPHATRGFHPRGLSSRAISTSSQYLSRTASCPPSASYAGRLIMRNWPLAKAVLGIRWLLVSGTRYMLDAALAASGTRTPSQRLWLSRRGRRGGRADLFSRAAAPQAGRAAGAGPDR